MRKEAGFTLVEILVAIFLMSLLVLGMSFLPVSFRNLRIQSETQAVAYNYAENILEQQRSLGFENIVSRAANEWTVVPFSDQQTGEGNIKVNYEYRVDVTGLEVGVVSSEKETMLIENNSNPQLKKVTVTVRWNVNANPNQIQLSALVGN